MKNYGVANVKLCKVQCFNIASSACKVVSPPSINFLIKVCLSEVTCQVILSAGAISSPQLLLLSGIGPKQDLERVGIPVIHDLPGVGQNLHNHVASYVTFKLQKEQAKHRLDWVNVLEYMLNRRGSMSSTGMSQVTGILNSKFADPDGQHPDLQFFFRGFYAGCSRTGAVDEVSDPEHPEVVETLTITPVVLHPKSRGYLTLRNSDPLEHPMLFPNYLSAEEDVDTLVEGIKIALKFGESKSLQDRWGIDLDKAVVKECLQAGEWGTDPYWKCVVRVITGPENHQVGTCKMGDSSDPTAVVDPELRVIGVKGLRVMDCSVIPVVPSGNTAAPAIMIAERGSVFIHNTWDTNKPPQVFSRFGEDGNNNNNQKNNQNGYVAPTNNNNQQGYGAATNSNNQYGHTTPKNNNNQQTTNANNKWDANSNKWDTNSNNQHVYTTPTNNNNQQTTNTNHKWDANSNNQHVYTTPTNQQTTNTNNKWDANSHKWDTNSNHQHGHAAPANGNNWDRNSNHHNGQAWDPNNNKWDTNHNNQHDGAWDPNSHKWDTNHNNQHGRAWDQNTNKWDTNQNNQHGHAWDSNNNKWDTNNNQHGHA